MHGCACLCRLNSLIKPSTSGHLTQRHHRRHTCFLCYTLLVNGLYALSLGTMCHVHVAYPCSYSHNLGHPGAAASWLLSCGSCRLDGPSYRLPQSEHHQSLAVPVVSRHNTLIPTDRAKRRDFRQRTSRCHDNT